MNDLSILKDKDPIHIFNTWLKEAEEHPEINQANAMVLSNFNRSTSHIGGVSSRVVLLKEIQEEMLIFYTNYNSVNKNELVHYPSALNFYWSAISKQIRLEGKITKIKREQSLQYWKTRSWESQISQYISKQSTKLEDPNILEKKWQEAQKQFHGKEVPCPPHWGGYAFSPHSIEFWMEKPHRLHDRLLFVKKTGFLQKKWTSHLLYP